MVAQLLHKVIICNRNVRDNQTLSDTELTLIRLAPSIELPSVARIQSDGVVTSALDVRNLYSSLCEIINKYWVIGIGCIRDVLDSKLAILVTANSEDQGGVNLSNESRMVITAGDLFHCDVKPAELWSWNHWLWSGRLIVGTYWNATGGLIMAMLAVCICNHWLLLRRMLRFILYWWVVRGQQRVLHRGVVVPNPKLSRVIDSHYIHLCIL